MNATDVPIGATRWGGNLAIFALVLICGYTGQSLIKYGLRWVGEFRFNSLGSVAQFFLGCAQNGYIWLGVFSVGIGFALWIAFLSRMDISQAALMIALAYLPWLLIGRFVFQEKIGVLRIIGAVLITIGVICVGYSKPK